MWCSLLLLQIVTHYFLNRWVFLHREGEAQKLVNIFLIGENREMCGVNKKSWKFSQKKVIRVPIGISSKSTF